MARWAAFVGLTGVVVTLLLALARLSQRLVREGNASRSDADGPAIRPGTSSPLGARTGNPVPGDPAIPVFEPASARSEPRSPPQTESLSTGALLVNVAFTQGLFGALLAAGAVYFEVPWAAFGVGGSGLAGALPGVGLGIGVGLALWLASEGASRLADAAGVGYDERLRGMLTPESTVGWAVLLGAVLPTVAVVEEFIFRGAVIGAVAVGLGASPWLLAVVSSAAFGAAHGAQGRVGIAVTGGLGFVLAAAFVLTGSLLVVIVAHYLVNALEFLVHEWASTGFRPGGGS